MRGIEDVSGEPAHPAASRAGGGGPAGGELDLVEGVIGGEHIILVVEKELVGDTGDKARQGVLEPGERRG